MTDETKNYIIKLFAQCVAFILLFMVVAIVGGFIGARLMGLPVDLDRFYTVAGQVLFLCLGAVLTTIVGGGKNPNP